MAELGDPRGEESPPGSSGWREFRRARHALWGLLPVVAAAGAAFHDVIAHSFAAKAVWLAGVVALIGYPLRYLFGFRCPRCGGTFLATGGLRDFLGLGRILWAKCCGSCALPAGEVSPSRSDQAPESRSLS